MDVSNLRKKKNIKNNHCRRRLETELLKIRHMLRPILYYLTSPNFVLVE